MARCISTNYTLNRGYHFSPLTKQGTYSSKTNLSISVWCLKLGGMNIAQKIIQHRLMMEKV